MHFLKRFEPFRVFWVCGLALSLIMTVAGLCPLLGLRGEDYEFVQFFLLGTLFPILGLGLVVAQRVRGSLSQTATLIVTLLALIGIARLLMFAGNFLLLFFVALTLFLLCYAVIWRFRRPLQSLETQNPVLLITVGFGAIISSMVCVTLPWWYVPSLISTTDIHWWTKIPQTLPDFDSYIVISLIAIAGMMANFRTLPREWPKPSGWLPLIQGCIVAIPFGFACLRPINLGENGTLFHHWGVYVMVAEMVRQGGWLLWDVPSQYGFLSILLLAFQPFKSIWYGFYLLNAVSQFFVAMILFMVLLSLKPGRLNFMTAAAITIAAVFLIPGAGASLSGPQVFPSVGGYRFGCCYALLAIMYWESQVSSGQKRRTRILAAGTLVWLLGSLWSSECMAYCSIIWFPACALMIYRGTIPTKTVRESLVNWLKPMSLWLLAALGSLLGITSLISIYYKIRLGHFPDVNAFFDYSRAFRNGFGALPIDPQGNVWILVLAFVLIATVTAAYLRQGFRHPALSMLVGAGSMVWITSSYFVGRSHPNNVANLVPILTFAFAITLYALVRYPLSNQWKWLAVSCVVPFFVVVLSTAFGNIVLFLQKTQETLVSPLTPSYLESTYPHADPMLTQLLTQAHAKPTDPIEYLDINSMPCWQSNASASPTEYVPRLWMPISPGALVQPLDGGRVQTYIARFTERTKLSGWLIESQKPPFMDLAPVYQQLQKTHTKDRVYQNDTYRLTWYTYSPKR